MTMAKKTKTTKKRAKTNNNETFLKDHVVKVRTSVRGGYIVKM
jgi:hypothetical protein